MGILVALSVNLCMVALLVSRFTFQFTFIFLKADYFNLLLLQPDCYHSACMHSFEVACILFEVAGVFFNTEYFIIQSRFSCMAVISFSPLVRGACTYNPWRELGEYTPWREGWSASHVFLFIAHLHAVHSHHGGLRKGLARC